MKANNNIQEKIENTFKAAEAIKQVPVSPFFKDKTMQRMFSKKEEEKVAWSWFTPKLQLATLACVIVLNVVAFKQLNKTSYDENINQLAESYGFSASDTNTLLN
ncbi:hypothetical protein KO494_03385 [Lacinutrix sp. C3R15]|uniref:hypothetical protein n=1 Tax=Flavobacteriaceae TaxID=49546 RepID=UPI001C08D205|nr:MULTISPECIES: hypothetical protein [Flavobacteriaceae]MBU2938575.1 hypothetical protein [Lacinutrix sp. C3R15]MDO6621889.1 hypothetical protein [Oceanihabitans sp. 1_MG-2023]